MQRGVPAWEAAGFPGMPAEALIVTIIARMPRWWIVH